MEINREKERERDKRVNRTSGVVLVCPQENQHLEGMQIR